MDTRLSTQHKLLYTAMLAWFISTLIWDPSNILATYLGPLVFPWDCEDYSPPAD